MCTQPDVSAPEPPTPPAPPAKPGKSAAEEQGAPENPGRTGGNNRKRKNRSSLRIPRQNNSGLNIPN